MSGRKRKRQRRRSSRPGTDAGVSRAPSRAPSLRRRIATVSLVAAAVAVSLMVLGWLGTPRAGAGRSVEVTLRDDQTMSERASLLAAAGVVDHPFLFRMLLLGSRPFVQVALGSHLLTDDLTPAEVLRRVVRLSSRARSRVVIPEGFNRFQIADRLEQLGVSGSRAFAVSATDRDVLSRLGVTGDSAEGYLFPATYDLFRDSDPTAVVGQMVAETKKRLAAIRDKDGARFGELEAKYGFHEREILTLASVVEKEAARPAELPIIASVFFNRLDDADFRPVRSLQSDPTAAYGCLVSPDLDSCRGYAGRVLPAMLRDTDNAYNTYRHPGLPPGPIGSPGTRAVEAVLEPGKTDYLFFVATGDGRHAFSHTLEEHQANIKKPR